MPLMMVILILLLAMPAGNTHAVRSVLGAAPAVDEHYPPIVGLFRHSRFPVPEVRISRRLAPVSTNVQAGVFAQLTVDIQRSKGASSSVPANRLPIPPGEPTVGHHDDTTGVRHRIGRERRPNVKHGVPTEGGASSKRGETTGSSHEKK